MLANLMIRPTDAVCSSGTNYDSCVKLFGAGGSIFGYLVIGLENSRSPILSLSGRIDPRSILVSLTCLK
jgi:hypothetical protein